MLLLFLIASSLLAYVWPDWIGAYLPPAAGAFWQDPFSFTNEYTSWLVGVTMFAVGMLLPRDEVRQVVRRWPTVLGGTTIQYLVMPLLAYLVGRLFRLEGTELIGVVMVGCVPGAMASNVLTLAARGNTSYSVSLTTTATLTSPIVVPLALWLTLSGEISSKILWNASITLLLIVVLPVVSGFAVMNLLVNPSSKSEPAAIRRVRRLANLVAHIAILWIIANVVGVNRANLGQISPLLVLALLIMNLGGYTAGFTGATVMRLPDTMRRALTLEVGMQNAGLGVALAKELFRDGHLDADRIAVAPAIYTFGCMLTGTALAQIWSRWPDKNEAAS